MTKEHLFSNIDRGAKEGPQITLNDTLLLGSMLEYLRFASKNGHEVGEKDEKKILGTLSKVETTLETTNINSQLVGRVSQVKKEIEEKHERSDSLDLKLKNELERKSVTWLNLLRQELAEENRISAADTGILAAEKLLDSPDNLFSDRVWGWLDDMPRNDLKESCRSIAVGNPISSVMLSLRAVEYCLQEWHEQETGEELDASWGSILNAMISYHISDEKEDGSLQEQLSGLPPVLSNLYYLKEKRNEVNHPKKSPSLQEGQRTLMIAVGTITEIYNEQVETQSIKIDGSAVEVKMDAESDSEIIMDIIDQLSSGVGNSVAKSRIYNIAIDSGFSEREVKNAIHDLLMDGYIYEPSDDKVTPI
ncbi:hypothetical protein ACFR9U_16300 [Halorientalis brevis]|uniref:Uncharacterized protein n=1 Tax=Halorientalis brevis TaxID=1126241 RepID=A0ABD6CE55_9EURY|nr:hypothetical protein [Halorientalis brevis]